MSPLQQRPITRRFNLRLCYYNEHDLGRAENSTNRMGLIEILFPPPPPYTMSNSPISYQFGRSFQIALAIVHKDGGSLVRQIQKIYDFCSLYIP